MSAAVAPRTAHPTIRSTFATAHRPYLVGQRRALRASHSLARDGDRGDDAEPSLDPSDWRRAHLELTRLARVKGAYDAEEAVWLRTAFAAGVHTRLGYATFAEYLERTFGYGPRVAHERLRVAQALAELPHLLAMLERGEFTWSAVRELTRVAVPETEADWARYADGKSVREIERDVAGRLPGDAPDDRRRREAATRRLVLDVSPEVFATFREAVGQLRRQTETPISDEEALLEMARRVLGGASDDGEASYQIALTVCPSCGHGTQSGRGEDVDVDPVVVEQAECDARSFVAQSGTGSARAHVGTGAPCGTTVNCSPGDRKPPPASQTIPPATRRRVVARDRSRCVVPGCRCTTYVDLHHLKFRADGGDHDDTNLVVLCGAHHRAVHRGMLRITGNPTEALAFAHADGTPYGRPVDPTRLDVHRDVTLGLKALGLSSREAEAASRAALAHVGTGAPWDALMRAALRAVRGGLDRI